MPHVHIDSSGVGEKPPIARRLIMPSMVQIEHTPPLDLKEMVTNLMRKPRWGMVWSILVDQESIFSL
jgi:hypothetical protein